MDREFLYIALLFSVFNIIGAWRPFYFAFDKVEHTKNVQTIGFLNCSFIRTKRNTETFCMNANLVRDMIKPQLDVLIIVEGSQNEKLEVANITNMDFCSFLEGKGAFKIMELWRNELMRSSNVPKKCPLKKGTVLNVNKFNINPDNFPPYVPEAGLRLQAILKERSVVLLTLNIHGVVKYKKSSRMRG
ncbi:uncharacterized protein LOC106094742 [Stomoxys calcitrans]|uniref:uncharacterized protein LOC106094742 n=1 Tax=Stomoxys calcitrans TaxID=35570 RepID=UPI0027E3479B|nr:uncharacterized protein LOC106094742 [Stomoxys calcitrans]